MKRSTNSRKWIGLCAVSCFSAALADVKLTEETVDGRTAYRMENERVTLLIGPAHGGNVTSYRDKKGGNVELILQAPQRGLCMDHFQTQRWPGEMLDAAYTPKVIKSSAEECVLHVAYEVKGEWQGTSFPKVKGLHLEKTYRLRAGSPSLECKVKFTAPKKESKLFSYWIQNVFFPGGQYDPETDMSFRPSVRGVRRKKRDDTSRFGREDWLKDFSDGWQALLDTKAKTGLVVLADYNALNCSYVNGGNMTLEPMYRIQYLPPGGSVAYTTHLVPVAGLDNVVAACEDYIVGYSMRSDAKGSGTVSFTVVRSVNAPKKLTVNASVMSVGERDKVAKMAPIVIENVGEQPQVKTAKFSGTGSDPLVLQVRTAAELPSGVKTGRYFEDYYNGAYQWDENITVDMQTPCYVAERPVQELGLQKPKAMRLNRVGRYNYWYVEGFMDHAYDVVSAVRLTCQYRPARMLWKRAFVAHNGAFGSRLSAFPYDYGELLKYNVVIFGGAKRDALNDVGIEMLSDFLTAGGGMLVLGGPMAYSNSRLAGTRLAEMWPVTVSDEPLATANVHAAQIEVAQDVPFLEDLDWSLKPSVQYLHEVTVRPSGKVILTAGGKPFLVIGEIGPRKGRVACVLGAPIGTLDRGKMPFWEWSDWKYLLRQILWWLGGNDYQFHL